MSYIGASNGIMYMWLPFRYLGMPISSQRLKVAGCELLTEKIISKIRTWGPRNMSYVARATLINAVLLNLHSYWVFIFVIPKTVLKKIISICRNFLWDGKVISNRSPPIAWDDMCRHKNEGGLGIRTCINWNVAAIGKLV